MLDCLHWMFRQDPALPKDTQAIGHRWVYIGDPLSLVEPGPQGPVQVLLTKVSNAWRQIDLDEALCSCYAAMRCASQTNDIAGIALAQLYLADTCARYERLAEGVNWARRAAKRFRLLGNNYNTMVARLLLARLEYSLRNLDQARQDYQQALDICQKLQIEEKRAARREAAWYGQIAEEIRDAIAEVSTTVAERFDQTHRLDSIPILNLSDGPDMGIGEHLDRAGHVTATGKILIAGRIYHPYPLGKAAENEMEFKPGAVYFALVIPEDGWLDPTSKEGDYALVQWKPQVAQEGPGVLWTGEKWVGGRFERDVTTGDICFVPPRPHIIGEEQGYVVALLKPA